MVTVIDLLQQTYLQVLDDPDTMCNFRSGRKRNELQDFTLRGGGTLFGDSKRVRNRSCANHAILGGSGGMPPPKFFLAALRLNLAGFSS